MSEIAPFSEEFNTQPAEPVFINFLKHPVWPEFRQAVAETEAAVVIYDPLDDTNTEITSQYAIDLSEVLGWDYNGADSKVEGWAYRLDTQTGASQEPVLLKTDSATYHGVDLCFYDGRWQAMLEFYQAEYTDKIPNGTYHIPPNEHHLFELSMKKKKAEADTDVIEIFDQDVKSARAFVRGDDFKINLPEHQRILLNEITEGVDREVPHELRDAGVILYCNQYYTAYDDMAGFDLREFFTDHRDTSPNEFTPLTGIIETFEYPELKTIPPEEKLTPEMLNLNDGAYCLVLRNEENRKTHYVLPQTVFGIICPDERSDDERSE